MTLAEVEKYIAECDKSELSTINDAISDRLDTEFGTDSEEVTEETVTEETPEGDSEESVAQPIPSF